MDSSLLLSVVCFKVAPGRKTEGKKHLPLGSQYVWVSQECTPLDLVQPHPGASPGGQEMVETSIPSQCDYARRKGAQSVSQSVNSLNLFLKGPQSLSLRRGRSGTTDAELEEAFHICLLDDAGQTGCVHRSHHPTALDLGQDTQALSLGFLSWKMADSYFGGLQSTGVLTGRRIKAPPSGPGSKQPVSF